MKPNNNLEVIDKLYCYICVRAGYAIEIFFTFLVSYFYFKGPNKSLLFIQSIYIYINEELVFMMMENI
jgi:hypothetical protein